MQGARGLGRLRSCRGVKLHGERGVVGVLDELSQGKGKRIARLEMDADPGELDKEMDGRREK